MNESNQQIESYEKKTARTRVEHVEIQRESVDIELIDEVFIYGPPLVSVRDASTSDFLTKQLYRRIVTSITEREEFIEKAGDILPEFDRRTNPMWIGKLYDAGCRFVEE